MSATPRPAGAPRRTVLLLVAVALTAAGCSFDPGSGGDGSPQSAPKGCITVDVASSPEKVELFTDLARRFNDSSAAKEGGCRFVRVLRYMSGETMKMMAEG